MSTKRTSADFNRVHFIGIGGAGMSGIARVMIETGYQVTGSDLKESHYTQSLRRLGARIDIGHQATNVKSAQRVVVSSAVPSNNPELKAAEAMKIPVYRRAEMIAYLGQDKKVIAVAGTHGKTTTTSMTSIVLENGGLEPTFLIGGELNDIGSNARSGGGEYLITEADESDGSLLFLQPTIAVITNIEADHLDYYHDYAQIEAVFTQFLQQVTSDGFVLLCGDQPNLKKMVPLLARSVLTYGLGDGNDFQAKDVRLRKNGSSFDIFSQGQKLGPVDLKVLGIHNVYNALAATAVALMIGLDFMQTTRTLHDFQGVKRRLEEKGRWDGICLVDDYAHHPTEIEATLEAAKQGGWERIVCVFQPHRYTRTKALSKEFGNSFKRADVVVLTDIYAAGEEPIPGVTGKLIFEAIKRSDPHKELVYLTRFDEIRKWLMMNVRAGDLVLTMGAGDIWMVGEEFSVYMDAKKEE